MERNANASDIRNHIAKALEEKSVPPRLDAVRENVGALMSAWPSDKGLYPQLKRLADFIEQTKFEIAALRPDEVKAQYLPRAADELDAIVQATAEATNRIMDAVEVVESVMGALEPVQSERLMDAVTSIYEACSFQDITGQRITKVVNTLKVIEQRVDQMIRSVGAVAPTVAAENATPATGMPPLQCDADLLNGPALPGEGRTQAEIDALLGF